MPSNFPPGYSEDGDAIEHGRDSAIYQELRLVREKYQEWFRDFEHEFPNDECGRTCIVNVTVTLTPAQAKALYELSSGSTGEHALKAAFGEDDSPQMRNDAFEAIDALDEAIQKAQENGVT